MDVISRVETRQVRVSPKTVWRFVQIHTAGRHIGLGEFSYDAAPGSMAARVKAAAIGLVGAPARRVALGALRPLLGQGMASATAYSALDQALADIEAQRDGVSLAHHLGAGDGERLFKLYANINRRTVDRTPAGFAASARDAVAAGFDAVKLAPFDGLSPPLCGTADGTRLIASAMARIEAVAAAIGPGLAVMVDCHWRLTSAAAEALIGPLAAAGVVWFECPLPEVDGSVADLVRLRRKANAGGMRLCGLETAATWEGFAPFVEAGAYDVVMPDVKHAGGHAAILEIAERAAACGVATSLHNPTGPVAHAASLHLCAALGSSERLECQFDETQLFDALTDPPPPPRQGSSRLPDGTGLGVTLRDDLPGA